MAKLTDDTLQWTLEVNGKPAMKELNQLEQATRKLEQTNKGLRVEMDKMEANGKKNTEEYKNLAAQIKANNAAMTTNKARMAELRKEVGLTSLTTRQLRSEAKRLRTQLDNTTPGTAEWEKLRAELAAVQGRMTDLNTSGEKTNAMFGQFKNLLPALGIGAAVGMVAQLGKELLGLAIQLEGDNRRATIVFGDSLGYVEAEAKKLSKAMGVTNKEFIAAAAGTADLLIPLDFTRDAAAKMSTQLQSMAGALDEWTGGRLGAAEVSNILTKAMLGENEQLKQLGIAIRKDSKEFTDLVKLKMQDASVTKAQAEAMATLELIQKKSADAQTAYTQSGNELLRMQKGVARWWRQMKEDVVGYFSESASEKIQKEGKTVNMLAVELTNANTTAERRNVIYEQLKSISPDIVKGIDAENVSVSQLKTNMAKYNEELVNRILISKLTAEEEDALAKAAAKGADARMLEVEISSKMADINSDIALSQEDYSTKVKQTIDYLIGQGAEMDEVLKKSNIQIDRNGILRDYRTEEQKQLDEIMLLTNSRNMLLEEQNKLEGDTSGITKRLEIARNLLGIDQPVPGGGGGNGGGDGGGGKKTLEQFIAENKEKFEAWKKANEKYINDQNEYELTHRFGDVPLNEKVKEAEKEEYKIAQARAVAQAKYDAIISQEFNLGEEESIEDDPHIVKQMIVNQMEMDLWAQTQEGKLAIAEKTMSKEEMMQKAHQYSMQKMDQETNKKKLENAMQYVQMASQIANALSMMYTAQMNRELKAAGDNEAAKEAIQQKYARKQQNVAVMQAIMNGALAVMSMWANSPNPIIGAIYTAIVAGVTAAEVGVIKSQQFATGNRQKVIGNDDGRTYNAQVLNSSHRSGLYNEPTYVPGFGLFGETKDPELVFNPEDTKRMLNSPGLIDAINMTLGASPQYATGNSREIIKETNTVTNSLPADQIAAMNRFSEMMERLAEEGVRANLVADENYIRTHKKKVDEYDVFKNKVSG